MINVRALKWVHVLSIYSKKPQCDVLSSVFPLPWKRRVAVRCWFSWSSWVAHVQLVTGRCVAAVQTKSWIIVLWLVPGRKVYPSNQLVIYKKYSWPLVLFWHPEMGEETKRMLKWQDFKKEECLSSCSPSLFLFCFYPGLIPLLFIQELIFINWWYHSLIASNVLHMNGPG